MSENILSLSGNLDSEGASGIEAMFRQTLEGATESCVTFDMARVSYLDSSGLRAFFQCLRLARQENIRLCFRNCSANILALLRITHFDRFCELQASGVISTPPTDSLT